MTTSETKTFEDRINTMARSIPPSKILALTALAARLREEGKDLVSLTAGEPDFQTPEPAKRAGIEAIRGGATRYTAAAGEPALRAKVAETYSARWGLSLTPDQVCLANGAKPALYCLVSILMEPGDELLYALPYWASYEPIVRMRGAVPVAVPTRAEDGFKLRPEALAAALTPRAKILLLNNPGNPTGSVYSADELMAIADLARERDLIILSDEIYESLVFDGLEHQSLYNLAPWCPERTVVVSGFSKSYAMTGWRIGYAIGDPRLIRVLANYQSHSHSCPSQISQRAALAALSEGDEALQAMRTAFQRRLDYCRARFERLGLPVVNPQGAFYFFFDTERICRERGWTDADEFCRRLLEEKGLALIPGGVFGMPSWARLSFAASDDELASGLDRLERFLE